MNITQQGLVNYLREKQPENAKWLDKVKIVYRPYICPFDELLLEIPEGSSVFDIGCGSGMFLSLVKEFRAPKKLGGCEIQSHLVENTNQLLNDFTSKEIYEFDGKTLPKSIESYDVISMIDVFHHIPKQQQFTFLKDLVNQLRPGTKIIFKDIQKESILVYWNKIHDLLLAGEIGNEINSKTIERYFVEELNLKLLSKSKKQMLLYPHFTLILEK